MNSRFFRRIRPAKPSPQPEFVHQHPPAVKVGGHNGDPVFYRKPAGMTAYIGPDPARRALPGKARRRARKAARAGARR